MSGICKARKERMCRDTPSASADASHASEDFFKMEPIAGGSRARQAQEAGERRSRVSRANHASQRASGRLNNRSGVEEEWGGERGGDTTQTTRWVYVYDSYGTRAHVGTLRALCELGTRDPSLFRKGSKVVVRLGDRGWQGGNSGARATTDEYHDWTQLFQPRSLSPPLRPCVLCVLSVLNGCDLVSPWSLPGLSGLSGIPGLSGLSGLSLELSIFICFSGLKPVGNSSRTSLGTASASLPASTVLLFSCSPVLLSSIRGV